MNTKKEAAGLAPIAAVADELVENYKPDYETVKGRVLDALLQGRNLTHKEVWFEFGSSRASHHIYSLRQEGWPVITDRKEVLTSDHGRKATIAFYRLPTGYIKTGAI